MTSHPPQHLSDDLGVVLAERTVHRQGSGELLEFVGRWDLVVGHALMMTTGCDEVAGVSLGAPENT